MSNLY